MTGNAQPNAASAKCRRILFVWTGLTSYMGDCWRALAVEPGVLCHAAAVVLASELCGSAP